MTNIEQLEDILHKEKMKEPLPKYDGQTQGEWQQEMDGIIDKYIPYGHKNKWNFPFVNISITEYSRQIGYHLELQRLDNLEDNISDKVKPERYDRIMTIQQEISLEKNKALVGKKDLVIIDKSSEDENWSIARSYRDAPEIDNYVKIDEYIPEGQFVDVEYIEAFEYDLSAKRIK